MSECVSIVARSYYLNTVLFLFVKTVNKEYNFLNVKDSVCGWLKKCCVVCSSPEDGDIHHLTETSSTRTLPVFLHLEKGISSQAPHTIR